jgi:hydroxymethylglutaryl-CoA reductase
VTTRNSRFPGFYKMSIEQRRQAVSEAAGVDPLELTAALHGGGLGAETADKFVENVLGTYALPFGVALNVRVNGKDYIAPMVVEEPSVVAAASNAAKMARAGGGFTADVDAPIMTCQVQVHGVSDPAAAASAILAARTELLELANRAVRGLFERGGGARDLAVRLHDDRMIVAHVYVDCRDAMGANLVNNVAEAIGDRIAALAGGSRGLRILSNLCDRRCVRVRCAVPEQALATDTLDGAEVALGIENASRFAEADPYRAATHNKGIMNGVDAVVMATGNDWRAVEAGAHAFAARNGRYEPLATFRRGLTESGAPVLFGSLEMPLALGTVGGTLRVHPAARIALRLLGTGSASEIASVAAAVGLSSNLAALRALSTDGIQKGHMALHARAVAIAAGAVGDEVEGVAHMIFQARDITVDGATRALRVVRSGDCEPR